jgi:hypothetical protein
MRQGRDDLTLDWYPVLVNLAVERLAKRDHVISGFAAMA